jgi:phosphomannomutase
VKKKKAIVTTLRQSLSYEPVELLFGTSGLRGRVQDITHLEAWVTTRGFLSWLRRTGEVSPGNTVFVAGDLRPSTTSLDPDAGFRGEILQAVVKAITDEGLVPGWCGLVPTPAVTLVALARRAASVMVTGSHVPFDRNGIKFVTPRGEVSKQDEQPILAAAGTVRTAEYGRPAEGSIFDDKGMIRSAHRVEIPAELPDAREEYLRRWTAAFPRGPLEGRKILVWEHSAVGRELLARILRELGAEVRPAGRSSTFVAVDTEAVSTELIREVQSLVDAHGPGIDAVVSTDGDGDRPLVLAVQDGRVRFVPGDLLGLLSARYLGARHAAVPVNASDAVDEYCRRHSVELVKTRIGSPHVVAAMKEVGWESNGGFLTAAPLSVPGGGVLPALPTRDAVLPILCVLYSSLGEGVPLASLLDSLPRRFGRSAVVRGITSGTGRDIIAWLTPSDESIGRAAVDGPQLSAADREGRERALAPGDPLSEQLRAIVARLESFFTPADGYWAPRWIDWTDGARIGFSNGDIAHVRPSGNAPEMRFYAVAGTAERTEAMVAAAVGDNGIVQRMAADSLERAALAGYRASPRPLVLLGAVQHYDWGGDEFIAGLVGRDNSERIPWAELWMGTHSRGPASALLDGTRIPLDRLLAADPILTLGAGTALQHAGRLPYLFKVLDVRLMASIQAHPSKIQAEAGFSRENAAGIPLDAPQRNYRDDNHKPEVHAALTELWMLHGFRPLEEMVEVLAAEPEFLPLRNGLADGLSAAGRDPPARSALLRGLYERVMTMPQQEIDSMLDPLVARLELEESGGRLLRENPGYWALRAARTFPLLGGHRDRGMVSIYLLNLVHLAPGQGTFQPAGTLHAYLEGANVELMANSDNVLRGGITAKHVDVPELLATLSFRDGHPQVLEGRATSETSREYETPAEEFALERVEVSPGVPYSGGREHGADTLIVVEGAAALVAAGRSLPLARGSIVLVPADMPYSIAARAPRAVLFKAGVPALP